ncbi:RNA-guided endonuclease InsQ/TnpB family protein [Bifidobacterium adolescentis]|uniref:RNA-guided endonuclease InsQ/TnpB family protein n=1 Tax=Bifidobacterium adolescentis TaxID=1680 RepID=UPI002B4B9CC4|nr:transposase [Bifidobacterium adolescentis]MDB1432760.1 transposase [Bifidobacterium adolescentis]MDB1544363.1 transposase [Bifidobacterium adolescentis]
MSQKVRIDRVRHDGASVFLGVDHCGNPCWTRNPERVMVWLCDGWRTRFNQRREQRPHNMPVRDEAGGIVDWIEEPLGGPDVADLLSDKEARLRYSWMAGIPAPILASTGRIENTEWFAGLKRRKTIGGRVPGFKSRHRGLGFVCWRNASQSGNAIFHKTGRKSGVVVITGMNPSQWAKPGEKLHWRIAIHVRVSQPIRPYTSVHVDWTHRSLVFVNMPLPLSRASAGEIGIDRGCVHTLALSDGTFMDMPRPTKAELKRLKHLQRKMARQDRVNEARGGRTADFASKRRQKTLSRFNVLQGRIVRRRNDWIEKTTTSLAKNNILIAMEDLDVQAMTKRPKPKPDPANPGRYLHNGARAKAGLNRSILGNNWSRLMKRLKDKMDANGGKLVIVPAAYTSQACHECGHIAKGNRESQAVFRCVECGHKANADVNAAMNILSRALAKTGGGTA